MKNAQSGFAPLVLLIIAIVLIGGGAYFYSHKSQVSVNQLADDSNFGIRFQIPVGWKKMVPSNSTVDTSGIVKEIGYVFSDTGNFDGKFIIKKSADDGKPLGSTNIVYKNDAYEKIGVVQMDSTLVGSDAYKISTGGVSQQYNNGIRTGDLQTKHEYWYIRNNGSIYEIHFESSVEYYNKNQELINNLINSLQFTN